VTYIDDGFSTNIDPTLAALSAVRGGIVLIVGGSEKGLDFGPLGGKIKTSPNVKGLVVIGDVKDKILKAIEGFKGKILTDAKTMQEIIAQAQSLAKPNDTILFSPATASFGLFKNETDRAEQFVQEVSKL
jgi:UDP-N-acetylmuramoylalanine--D-glutamate ligase